MAFTTRKSLLACFFLVFIFFLAYWVALVLAPGPNVAGIENNTIYFVQRILNGSTIYSNPEAPPYAIAQYGPLYYRLVAGIAKLAGLGPDDVTGLFILNRIVSLILLLSTSLATYLVSRNIFNFSRVKSILVFALVFIFFEISSFARADSLANAFYYWSLLLFLLTIKQPLAKRAYVWLIASALLASLAFFSKQSSGSLALIICIGLLISKQYRFLFMYLLAFVLCLSAGFLIIHFTGSPQSFYQNIIKGVDNGIDTGIFINYIIGEFIFRPGLLWIVLMAGCIPLLKRKKTNIGFFFILLMSVQLLVSLLLSLKKGSSSNYFTEWWILVILATAYCWDDIKKMIGSIDRRLAYGLVGLVLIFRASAIFYSFKEHINPTYRVLFQQRYEEEKQVAAYLQQKIADSSVLVYNNIFSPDSYLNNLLFRQAIIPQNDIVVFGTWGRNVFDYSLFNRQLKDGTIGYIITKPDERKIFRLPIDMANYRAVDSMGGYLIFGYNKLNQ